MKRRLRNSDDNHLDLTSASDVLFSLVLFLLLSQQFMPLLRLDLPPVTARDTVQSTAHLLHLDASGTWFWSETQLGSTTWKSDLRVQLADVPASDTIRLLADRHAPAGLLIEGVDLLAALGHLRVAIVGSIEEDR